MALGHEPQRKDIIFCPLGTELLMVHPETRSNGVCFLDRHLDESKFINKALQKEMLRERLFLKTSSNSTDLGVLGSFSLSTVLRCYMIYGETKRRQSSFALQLMLGNRVSNYTDLLESLFKLI
jgi:hypothetical protein